ncbi:monocarboxylate transporter 10 isoform X1 [Nilaparvata lugens]|uniref:monocarboxylate transporter 10 isoform X1 n=1 Tax=Nilaparvata lugens TaxID=108931 RepID=UPI00193D7C0C|nr:monocarboxylate transporter 10 isoform X1 [Nilaparvata lugens]XP_039288053.1 monocarboxylate transporter 10 isoform X1 [Nilaparvata lugens]
MSETEKVPPPDGGVRAWSVMVASFLCNGVIFGLINSYSVVYVELQRRLTEAGVEDASSKASLVGSLTIGTTFFLSPVAGILTDKIGIRVTTFIGGLMAALGLFAASFSYEKVTSLYLTYGVLFGVGSSLAYTPSLVILGHYFQRYMGVVNGFVTAGSSTFTMLMPYLIDALLTNFGLGVCLRCLSLFMCFIMLSSLLFKPITADDTQLKKKEFKSLINKSIWMNRRYVYWAVIIPMALFGYFVPYVHMVKFVEDYFPGHDGKNLVFCIGVTSGLGRLIFGKIADYPRINRVYLQQLSFFLIGSVTMLMVVCPSFSLLVVCVLTMGLFDGCFISLLGPIAFDLCGHDGAGQAIGFLLGFCSFPLTIGPPIAGLIYDHTKSYSIPFFLAGIPPILGAALLFMVSCSTSRNGNDTATTSARHDDDTATSQLIHQQNGGLTNGKKTSSTASLPLFVPAYSIPLSASYNVCHNSLPKHFQVFNRAAYSVNSECQLLCDERMAARYTD